MAKKQDKTEDKKLNQIIKELRLFLETGFLEKSKIISELKSGLGNPASLTDFNQKFYPEFNHRLEEVFAIIERNPELKKEPLVKKIYSDLLDEGQASANKKAEDTLTVWEFGDIGDNKNGLKI